MSGIVLSFIASKTSEPIIVIADGSFSSGPFMSGSFGG